MPSVFLEGNNKGTYYLTHMVNTLPAPKRIRQGDSTSPEGPRICEGSDSRPHPHTETSEKDFGGPPVTLIIV